MPHLQLIAHQLESMLTMCLSEIFVQHNTVEYGHTSIHTIKKEENNISYILFKKVLVMDHQQEQNQYSTWQV
jgi:hypothetical protein